MKDEVDVFLPGSKEPQHVLAGLTILEVMEAYGLRLEQPAVALVNGQVQDIHYPLQPGDVVRFLYQIAGGAE